MASLSSLLNPSNGAEYSASVETSTNETNNQPSNLESSTVNSDVTGENTTITQNEPVEHIKPPTSITELLMQQSNSVKPKPFPIKTQASPSISNIINTSMNIDNSSNSFTKLSDQDDILDDRSPISKNNVDSDSFRGSYQTLLINARSRHLKKNDGEPYWRNEIQFEFLMKLFFNHKRVFTNPYYNTPEGFDWPDHFKFYKDSDGKFHPSDGEKLTFFELYLITLLKSSKISKILKARLMLDINYALNFTIICLLVNIGRLNTTVNFDYEMKSQFRTYHSIPSLQVGNHLTIIEDYYKVPENTDLASNPDAFPVSDNDKKSVQTHSKSSNTRNGSGYTMATVKQLQDTPRIKSILKSVNDLSKKIPKNYSEAITKFAAEQNHFNLVSVIFMICSYEYDIGKAFFPFDYSEHIQLKNGSTGSLLNDIWLRPKFKSSDKVTKFLWLIYTMLETNLSVDKILLNPFNNKNVEIPKVEEQPVLIDELALINHKNNEISPTILRIKGVIPKWNFDETDNAIDPKINDYDTSQEVDFAAQMKCLRTQFVETENKPKLNQPIEDSNIIDFNNKQLANHESVKLKIPSLRSKINDDEFSMKFYKPEKKTRTRVKRAVDSSNKSMDETTSDIDNQDINTFNTSVLPIAEPSTISNDNLSSDSKYDIYMNISDDEYKVDPDDTDDAKSDLDYEDDDNYHNRKRPREQTIEDAAIDPIYLSIYEDNENASNVGEFNYGYPGSVINEFEKGIDGSVLLTSCVKKRKTRKTIYSDPAIKLTCNQLESFLNRDNKSLHSNSKNAISKREKNRILANFMFELVKYKQASAKMLRKKQGNWAHFVKNRWDLNMILEKENGLTSYQDWGEFKTTMFKMFNQVNFVINTRMQLDIKAKSKDNDNEETSSFIDDIFSQV